MASLTMECFPNHEPFDIPHPARLIQQLNCGFSTSATSPTSRASTSLRPMVWVQSKLSLSSTSIRYHLCGDEQNELDKDEGTVKRVVTAVESELNNGVLHTHLILSFLISFKVLRSVSTANSPMWEECEKRDLFILQ